ncbi:MAG TPA: hypothetical protein VF608_06135, partial [Thermoanaerobaculia bacterium]
WIEKNRDWLANNTSGILVIQIRDSTFSHGVRSVASSGGPKRVSRGFSEWSAPIEGVFATRGSAMNFRSDFDLATLANQFSGEFLTTLEVELPNDTAPLTWNLTEKAAEAIIAAAPKQTNAVKTWWETHAR